MLDKIRENTEKISLLVDICEDLQSKASTSNEEGNNQLKINVAKEQILRSTFEIKKILLQIESRI